MVTNIVTQDQTIDLVSLSEEFPVDFAQGYKWAGYSRKDNATRVFENAGFVEGIDFEVFLFNEENLKGSRPRKKLKLTVEAFKMFRMMTGLSAVGETFFYPSGIDFKRKTSSHPKNS